MDNENRLLGKSKLYSLNDNADDGLDTNLHATFVIHDFEKSWNGQIITEEECSANMNTLINKPILVQYFNDGDKMKDHLGDHGVYITKNRDTGEDLVATNTFAIGTFTKVYIDEISIEGQLKRVLLADAILWQDRYYNVCSLLKEWNNKGIAIHCSCEYIFYNFEMNNGYQYIKSPFSYEGHTILNSEIKDGYDIVLPAYDNARFVQFNSAVAKDIEMNEPSKNNTSDNAKSEEGMITLDNIFKKSLNNISLGDLREQIFSALEKIMNAEEFNHMWLSNYGIFDGYFIYETYVDGEWKNFKVNFTKGEDNTISLDSENKIEVDFKQIVVPVDMAQNTLDQAVAEKDTLIANLKEELEEKQSMNNCLAQKLTEQEELVIELSSSINELNKTVESLNAYKEQMEAEQFERLLNEQLEVYKTKFEAVNAMDQFETEEVQGYIRNTLNAEKAVESRLALADILLGAITVETKSRNAKQIVVEPSKSLNNLTGVKPVIKATDLL